jgi:chemotaxis response regulator CheB
LTSLALTAGAPHHRGGAERLRQRRRDWCHRVHHFGGTVIATDEATSTQFAMPSATIGRPTITDHVVALDEVADLLTALITAMHTAG